MTVTAQSQLMTNHVAGQALTAQSALWVAATTAQTPMLFARDEDGGLDLTLPDDTSATGWTQVDLGAQFAEYAGLGSVPVVQAFAVSQDLDGCIWVALAVAASVGAASRLFLTDSMPASGDAAAWKALTSHLTQRTLPDGLVISQIALGTNNDHGPAPLLVVMGTVAGGTVVHYQINPDPSDTSWSSEVLNLPQDATACLGVAVGNAPGYGRGVYALCLLGAKKSLTFTTLPTVFEGHAVTRSFELAVPDGLDPLSLAALVTANGQTELYAAGNGVYRYPLSAQTASNLPGEWVADATQFSGVSELLVGADAGLTEISVWGQDARDVLVHTRGTKSGATIAWDAPVALAGEVTALAAYRSQDDAAGRGSAAMALGRSDGSLALLTQSPETSLWQPMTVALPQAAAALELKTYTTRIRVLDDDGIGLAGSPVTLRPSCDCAALVNGQYYALKAAVDKPVTTGPDGSITIVQETPDLAAPTYVVTAGAAASTLDPAASVKGKLRGITTGQQIATAQRSDGKPLFPNGADSARCDSAAKLVGQLMTVHDSLPADGTARPSAAARTAARTAALGVCLTRDRPEVLTGAAALEAASGLDAQWVSAGDLFGAMASGLSQAGQFFVSALGEAWEFVVDLGNRALRFVFEATAQVMGAINYVLKELLGVSLDDLIAWLGFVFDWGDILANHRVIAKVLQLGLNKTIADVAATKVWIADACATVRGKLINDKLIVDQSNAIFTSRARSAPQGGSAGDAPESNWGAQQLQNNASSIITTAPAIGSLDGLFSALTGSQIQIIENAIGQIQSQVLDGFGQGSFGQVLDELLQIVGAALINTAENLALSFADAITVVVAAFQAVFEAHWQIPVLTYVYEQIICQGDGSKLTLLDVVALLMAVPASVMGKLASGANLFTATEVAAITQQTSWDGLMGTLRGGTSSAAPVASEARLPDAGALAAAPDPAVKAAIAFQILAAIARSTACAAYILREAVPPGILRDQINEQKVGWDWATYVFSMVNLGLVVGPGGTPTARQAIDAGVTSAQILARLKDTFLVVYKLKNQKDSPLKTGLAYAESVFGVAITAAVCVSIGLEANEARPAGITDSGWKALYSLKFIQNVMTGLYRTFAFGPTLQDPRVKTAFILARGGMLGIRAAASIARAVSEDSSLIADIDD